MSTSPPESPEPSRSPAEGSIYNRIFWISYAANLTLVCANALTFRFAEFVAWLGGTEQFAGMIVSLGGAGALFGRLALGKAIDRHGVRPVWLFSSGLFAIGCLDFTLLRDLSPLMFLGRLCFAAGLAGMFTCSIVHIQSQVPSHRRTEVIGTLGSSGFLGLILGSQLGDFYLSTFTAPNALFTALFGTSLAFGLLYITLVLILTRGSRHLPQESAPSAVRLVRRYWPGPIVLVALVMGIGFAATTVFLTRYATQLGLKGVGTFFTAYAITAFIVRILSRNWGERFGKHRMVLIGLSGNLLGMLLLPFVSAEWHFVIPAFCCGYGHAFLFPVVVSVGSGTFPPAFRGTGTTVVLGFSEIGQMLFAPILGSVIDEFGFLASFRLVAACVLATAVTYALTAARRPVIELTENVFPAESDRTEPPTTEVPPRESTVLPPEPVAAGTGSSR